MGLPGTRTRRALAALPQSVRWAGLAAGLLAVLGPAGTAAAGGPLYRYEDERGVLHFTATPITREYASIGAPEPGAVRGGGRPVRYYDGVIALAARRHDVPPGLVKAIVATESNFDPRAVSPKGALGLMQLMPTTARALGVADPFETFANVDAGVRYLRGLLERYGRLDLALAAYNAGPTAVDRHGGVPPYRETREYVRRVLAYYQRYDADFAR